MKRNKIKYRYYETKIKHRYHEIKNVKDITKND